MRTARIARTFVVALAAGGASALAAPEPGDAHHGHACPVAVDAGVERARTPAGAARGGSCSNCVIELHVVLDNAFEVLHGGEGAQIVIDIVGAAEAIMSKPQSEGGLDLDLPIRNGTTFSGPQPWAHASDPLMLLNNFRGWSSGALPVPGEDRDVVVMFTGANLDGAVTGLSFSDSICTSNAIGVVSYFTSDTEVLGVTLAHMIGHMLGAGHDGIDNECDPGEYVMSPGFDPLAPATEFSPCSIEEINTFLASGAACLDAEPCGAADLAEPYTQLDFSDVVAFLVAFSEMDPAADLASPFGLYDFSDVTAFLSAFGAGCP